MPLRSRSVSSMVFPRFSNPTTGADSTVVLRAYDCKPRHIDAVGTFSGGFWHTTKPYTQHGLKIVSTTSPAAEAASGDAHALGFAPEIDVPTRYMQRTRDYYLALGYGNPYRWAQFGEVPCTAVAKPLAEACVGVGTTAAHFDPAFGDQGPGAAYNAGAKFYTPYATATDSVPDLRISHLGYDRKHTRADDQRSYFPLERLREANEAGRIGTLASRFNGAPTNRSQRVTMETDAPQILEWMREDGVDVAILGAI